jgi:hypothetical protein
MWADVFSNIAREKRCDYKKQIFINSVLYVANVDGAEDRIFFFQGSFKNVDYFTYARLVQAAWV